MLNPNAIFLEGAHLQTWPLVCKFYADKEWLNLPASANHLEAASGPGFDALAAAITSDSTPILAIDSNPAFIELGQARADAAGVSDKLQFVCGDITSHQYERLFDSVSFRKIITHCKQQEIAKICKNLSKHCNNDARVLFQEPLWQSAFAMIDDDETNHEVFEVLKSTMLASTNEYWLAQLTSKLKETGFRIDKIKYENLSLSTSVAKKLMFWDELQKLGVVNKGYYQKFVEKLEDGAQPSVSITFVSMLAIHAIQP